MRGPSENLRGAMRPAAHDTIAATPDAVTLPDTVRAAILAHARAEAPRECCGLLIGRGALIAESVPVANVHPTPALRYVLDPAGHIAANRRLRGTGTEVVGCYHSHPHGPPVPSTTDVVEAHYPEFLWLIASLLPEEPEAVRAFRIGPAGVLSVPLIRG